MIEILQSETFRSWLSGLRDHKGRQRILARLERMADGHLGDVKPVGDGVSEARVHHGPGYRLYFIRRGLQLIVMLGGGDKSSQQRDIEKAKQAAKHWRT
jgi:putative addiction module killer protein